MDAQHTGNQDRPDSALQQRVDERTAELSQALAVVEAQKRELEHALRMRDEIQLQLEAELEDARLLHGISAMLVDEHNVGELFQKLVDAATLIMRSDFGSIQRYDEARGELQLIATRGLNDEAVSYWQWVHPGRATTCGHALLKSQRVVVPDFESWGDISGSDDLIAFRAAGVRAAQSTPLLTRSGRLVGMITTHWTRSHEPQERDLRLIDIVARQAADLIERNSAAEALQHHARKLVEADRYKDEFLATLAHELRNPLAPIRNGLAVLKIGKPEQAQRVLPMMERQLHHMVHLIDDLLDVSRISRGMVNLKRARVQLSAVIDSAVETSRPLISAANHRFTITLPGTAVWLNADMTRVAQIISNLLNNAAKYTPPGGDIELVAEVIGDEVVVRVIDSGIGIPAAMLPRIFELFTQVDGSAERSKGGLGVGLALAKRLAEMHDGSVEVESAGGKPGAVFTLRLPIMASTTNVAEDDGSDGAPAKARALRILIVDDNEDAAETLSLLLQELGHVTSVVTEAPKAMAAALAFLPEIAVLDLGMPHLNGFDLARLLRAEPALRDTYLIALSGWGMEEDRARSRDAGMDHHLTKPVTLRDVEDALLKSIVAMGGGISKRS
ncbi:response regulator [Pseudoduganella sp. FT25W]|uniref:histidine kinase n=1 Tax=Duganella alba TaxID=2666081 RepID=A0A6L5QH57_9BURK|nr:ATP-binding protein [Duganella alba]MRX08980.1 response regulator [Duganella alba]MRX18974.1 response regulator [Duganella alba]